MSLRALFPDVPSQNRFNVFEKHSASSREPTAQLDVMDSIAHLRFSGAGTVATDIWYPAECNNFPISALFTSILSLSKTANTQWRNGALV